MLASTDQAAQVNTFSWTGVVPYAAILVLAIAGMNVFAVLLLGIVLAALQGVLFGSYDVSALGKDIFKGFGSMQEIFLLSMFVGGLGEFVKQQGGLRWVADGIDRIANSIKLAGNKAQQLAIAALVFISNLCIANNTVAIVISADVSRDLAQHHDITPRRAASLLDIFSCISQGLVPYGAQALLLGASFGLSPWDVVTQSYYCMLLALVALAFVLLQKTRSA